MYLRILNKNNLIDNTLVYPNKYAINNLKTFTIDENSLLTENYNEQLDSMMVRLSHLEERLDIEPLDRVDILFTPSDTAKVVKHMVVDTYTMREETLNQNNYAQKFYTYEISLMSETKLLEGVILPNLSITYHKSQYQPLFIELNTWIMHGFEIGEEIDIWTEYEQDDRLIGKNPIFEIVPRADMDLSILSVDYNNQTGRYRYYVRVRNVQVATSDPDVFVNAFYDVEKRSRTILEYVQEYMNLYCPKERIATGTHQQNSITISQEVIDKFQNVECPEFQWNAPTLREVLTDLFMVKDCVPIVQNRVLKYIDLTETKSPISSYNYIQWSQSTEDYISEIKMNLQNVMQTSLDNIDTTTTTTEYIPFTNDDYVGVESNLSIKTQFPILNIKHLWLIQTPYKYKDANHSKTQFVKVDLCNIENMLNTRTSTLVLEQKEWATKKVKYLMGWTPQYVYGNATTQQDIDTFYSQYKNFHLYFSRGSNEITGFNQLQKLVLGADQPTWKWIRALALASQVKNGVDDIALRQFYDSVANGKQYYSCFFQIEYETLADCVFQAGKSDYGANKKVIVDNQTNSWVDAYNQGNLEYQKANRLGNKAILINQRITSWNDRIQIGQTHYDQQNNETYIVYQAQYQIHKDHIEVNALACENYVLKDYFTGINSKIRTWVNAQDEALIRHDLNKYYCEFSFNNHIETIESDLETFVGNSYLSPINPTQQTNKIKQVMVKTYDDDVVIPDATNSYALNQITRLCGNSIVHTFGFTDNATVSKNVDTTIITQNDVDSAHSNNNYYYPTIIKKNTTQYGGIPLQDLYYVNGNNYFEYNKISYMLIDYINVNESQFIMPSNLDNFVNADDDKKFFINCLKKPLVKSTAYHTNRFEKEISYIKDNREIPKISTQFELCSETRDIYFTKNFIANEVDLLDGTRPTLHLYYALRNKYVNGATSVSGYTEDTSNLFTMSVPNYSNQFRLWYHGSESKPFEKYCFAIGTSQNDIWFGFKPNDNDQAQLRIYLNVLKERTKKVYNSSGIITGEI